MKKTVKDYIRTIVEFPHEGILFRDVTTLFADARGFRMAIDQLAAPPMPECGSTRSSASRRAASSSAARSRTSFRRLRADPQEGQAARPHDRQAYTLEYGEAVMEIHDDALGAGEKVLIVDDLLATGGTAEAGIKLVERLGAEVIGCAFVIDLPDLGGRRRLEALGMDIHALCAFEGHTLGGP